MIKKDIIVHKIEFLFFFKHKKNILVKCKMKKYSNIIINNYL